MSIIPEHQWMIDMIAMLDQFEDEHPVLPEGKECLDAVLALVPKDTLTYVRGFAAGRRKQESQSRAQELIDDLESGDDPLRKFSVYGRWYDDPAVGFQAVVVLEGWREEVHVAGVNVEFYLIAAPTAAAAIDEAAAAARRKHGGA